MVDEKQQPTTAESKTDAGTEAAKAAKSGRFKPIFLFAGGGVLAVLLGVALALFVIKPMTAGSSSEGDDGGHEPAAEIAKHDSHADKGHDAPKKKSGHGHDGAIFYTIQDIVINPAGTGGTRFLSVSFGFELGSTNLEADFVTREAAV
ncbi:MAG: hypothetical protein AB1744_06210, partial [Candidatus Zixiibacteriota bacterium]